MWLRLYTDILDNPDIQLLEPAHFKGYINLSCLAVHYNGMLPDIQSITWQIRLSEAEATALIMELINRGLIDASGTTLKLSNWDRRQPQATRAGQLLQGDWPTIRLDVLVRDDWTCRYCGAQATAVDHIIARSRGGTNDRENLVAVCKPCNSRKQDKTPEEAGMRLLGKAAA